VYGCKDDLILAHKNRGGNLGGTQKSAHENS